MVEIPILKFLFSDDMSLQSYLQGELSDFATVKRRILMEARSKNTRIPDHHYKLTYESEIAQCKTVSNLILAIAKSIADNYLVRNSDTGEIQVIEGKQCIWHQIIPFVPPLFSKASYLFFNTSLPDFNNDSEVSEYCKLYILPVCKHTAIPPATCPNVSDLRMSLSDIHIHLNGSVESDVLWQDFLDYPSKIYRELNLAYEKSNIVAEQLEQESHLLKPIVFHRLLRSARKMRKFFYDFIISKEIEKYDLGNQNDLLHRIVSGDDRQFPTSNRHPFDYLIPIQLRKGFPKMALECLMFVKIFDHLHKGGKAIESFFHFYFLIYGLSNKLVVHQPYQFGFDQFQKITLNRLRELTEQTYDNRFLQVFGNQLGLIRGIEGRISPKLTQTENTFMISQIEYGWNKFIRTWKSVNSKFSVPEPSLKLVTHFIKQPDDNKSSKIRHYNLRSDLWMRGKNLRLLLKKGKYRNLIVGIDAAANELHAPPEVFAPVFWKLRQADINRATFHVGEDFVHPLSGLRAIFEAVNFLELKGRDRIGHGTALGIDLKLWRNSVGEKLFIRIGEWVDNLIFVLSIRKDGYVDGSVNFQAIEAEVIAASKIIYGEEFSIDDLIESWKFRKYCPIMSLSKAEVVRNSKVFDLDYFEEIRLNTGSDLILRIFGLYHSIEVRDRYKRVEEINPFSILSIDSIRGIQNYLLGVLYHKEIAIETLPTSNIRISCAKDFSEYHFINWEKKIAAGDKMPKIIVGTDDPGIFSTNLLNEFTCIHELLISHCNYSNLIAGNRIAELVGNAQQLKF